MKELVFTVMCSLGGGDGGEVYIHEDVSNDEFELIKQYYEEYDDISNCNELEPLYDKIIEYAKDENEFELQMNGNDGDIEYCSYWITRIEGL